MGKLFYLMGKSASGKDTLESALLKMASLSLGRLVPYTTRPRRRDEVSGKTYYFVTEEEYQEMSGAGRVAESRAYQTVQGLWRYFTVIDRNFGLGTENVIGIGTLQSYVSLMKHLGEGVVVPLYVEVPDGIRLRRAIEREESQEKPDYSEMCRRFLADQEDFSEDKLLSAGIVRRFLNVDKEACLGDIYACVKENIAGAARE